MSGKPAARASAIAKGPLDAAPQDAPAAPDANPRPDRSSTLVLERSGKLFRVRYATLNPDGSVIEQVTPWRLREDSYSDAQLLWRKWKDALFEGMGRIPI